MAYTAGDPILDDEYNNFVNDQTGPTNFSINHIFGTGSGEYGMGQTAVSTVSAGGVITASQWNSLFTNMDNMANHVNISLTSTAAVSSGDAIAIKSALQTDLNSLAAQCAAGSPSATALSDGSASTVDSGNWTYNTSVTTTRQVTFASSNERRWFFNQGGKIKVSFSRVGSTGTGKNNEWDDITSRIGTIILKQNDSERSGGSATSTTISTSIGFTDLTGTYQTVATSTANTSPYTTDKLTLKFRTNGNNVQMEATHEAFSANFTDSSDNGPSIRMSVTPNNPTTAQGLTTAYTGTAGA